MYDNLIDLSFEQSFAELQRVIEELRGEALTLDRSLALYERGSLLVERCNTLLSTAELRVSQSNPGQGGAQVLRESFLDSEW